MMLLIWLAAALAGFAPAQDGQLAALHQTLVELRAQTPDPETMGAPEKLTVAKHQLRDWIEGQLGALKDEGDTKAPARPFDKSETRWASGRRKWLIQTDVSTSVIAPWRSAGAFRSVLRASCRPARSTGAPPRVK
jgi:hypothetical protein